MDGAQPASVYTAACAWPLTDKALQEGDPHLPLGSLALQRSPLGSLQAPAATHMWLGEEARVGLCPTSGSMRPGDLRGARRTAQRTTLSFVKFPHCGGAGGKGWFEVVLPLAGRPGRDAGPARSLCAGTPNCVGSPSMWAWASGQPETFVSGPVCSPWALGQRLPALYPHCCHSRGQQ